MKCNSCGEEKANGFRLALWADDGEMPNKEEARFMCTECIILKFDKLFGIGRAEESYTPRLCAEKETSMSGKMNRDKSFNVIVSWKVLERVASYYEFPVTVFFTNVENFPSGTRNNELLRKAKEFERRVKVLVKEYFGDGGD